MLIVGVVGVLCALMVVVVVVVVLVSASLTADSQQLGSWKSAASEDG